jgi:hypothetical protein
MSSYAKPITDFIIDLGNPGMFMLIKDKIVIKDKSFTPDKTILRIIFPEKKIYCP